MNLEDFGSRDVERVRSALDEYGFDAKADVIYSASRPIQRKKCLDIRRLLLADRSGNAGT
jgi:hypothetical protein